MYTNFSSSLGEKKALNGNFFQNITLLVILILHFQELHQTDYYIYNSIFVVNMKELQLRKKSLRMSQFTHKKQTL